MKTIYLVRHGESQSNAGGVFLGPTASLTDLGKQQAAVVAERALKLPVQTIIASTMARATETGNIIAKRIQKPIEYSDLFTERRHPASHSGRSKTDPGHLRYEKEFLDRFGDPAWRFEDAENFDDLNARASQALEYLENRPEENILAISHGIFMSILLARVVLGKELTGIECGRFTRTFHMDNTGLTILRYDLGSKWALSWHLLVWNDHSHLADS